MVKVPAVEAQTTDVRAALGSEPMRPSTVPQPQAVATAERTVVSVRTAPPAAAVLLSGSELGVTPLEVSMNKGSTLTLMLKKKGFAEHKLELRANDGSRVVTLRRLSESERERGRDRERSSYSARRAHERAARSASTAPAAPIEPSSPSVAKSSPYERF
jgi:hypothetical protein